MALVRGGLPYIWVTWLTPFLAGERSCEWAPWFQSRHTDIASPEQRSFDLRMWTAEHNAMVKARADELRAEGYRVYLEDQNDFKLVGSTAILSGKADIVALKLIPESGGIYIVLMVDCKTGKEKDQDVWQVLIYTYAVPKKHPVFVGEDRSKFLIKGEVHYKTKRVEVPCINQQQADHLFKTIQRVAGQAPERRPSHKECLGCKISREDCPDRIEGDYQPVSVGDF